MVCGLILLSAWGQAVPVRAVDLSVDLGKRYQTIDGFGTCLMFWQPEPFLNPDWQRIYWDDLGCSVLRMDMVPFVLTPNHDGKLSETPIPMGADVDANIKKFDWKPVDVFGQVAQAAKIYGHDESKVIASVWSPPPWMKDRGATISKENGNAIHGSLKQVPDNLQQFARYLAAYLKGFQEHYGIPVYAVSIENELDTSDDYDSCSYEPDEYVATLKAVHRELQQDAIPTLLQGPECCSIGNSLSIWNLWRQTTYIDAVRKDPEAMKALDIYSIHAYPNDDTHSPASYVPSWLFYLDGKGLNPPNPDKTWIGTRHDGKRYWVTEAGGEKNDWCVEKDGRQIGALGLAINIHNALVYGQNSMYVYWQLSDGMSTATGNSLLNFLDTHSPKYCAAKHFFRYIRPGAVRVDIGPNEPDGLRASAFLQSKTHNLTIVLINPSNKELPLSINLPNLWKGSAFDTYLSTETARFTNQPPNKVDSSGKLGGTIPAYSVMTLVGQCLSEVPHG